MTKQAYYFSHDSNARHDPKLMFLQCKRGMAGYGMWWVLVEMLRDAEDYKLPDDECVRNAFAMQTYATASDAHAFINECIETYKLLKTDGNFFWSESLVKRMEKKSNAGKIAATSRWSKKNSVENQVLNANAYEPHANAYDSHANAMRKDAIKVKESKRKESKEKEKEKENSDNDFIKSNNFFQEFKKNYPGNGTTINPECEIEFTRLIANGTSPQEIIIGAKNYDGYCRIRFADRYPFCEFIMNAENFLKKRAFKTDWNQRKDFQDVPRKVQSANIFDEIDF